MKRQEIDIVDYEPKINHILKEVLVGLSKSQKSIPPKYLYDKRGSEIFEQICKLPEYYPTRVEAEIIKKNCQEMASLVGDEVQIVEPGSGSGEKIRHLLTCLGPHTSYIPIEISKDALLKMTEELHKDFPDIKVYPVCADFTQITELPLSLDGGQRRRVVFFPGSTIGNFRPEDAIQLLRKFHQLINKSGGLLIGVDLKKNKDLLEVAYDDSQGVTAAFNLNLLERLNRETLASFNPETFEHAAFYNEELGRVEMHLVSRVPQLVKVNQTVFRFREGETIHTESSYKYSVEEFTELAAKAKFNLKHYWNDPENLFCVYYFET